MNMFATSIDPTESARDLCDQHVIKMTEETRQCIVAALLTNGAPLELMPLTKKGTHHKGGYPNHPVSKWVGASRANFLWACYHGAALGEEYERRYDKTHFSALGIEQCFELAHYIPEGEMTPFVRAFNQSKGENTDLLDTEKWPCTHEAYREFYRRDKASFARWNKFRQPPTWWHSNTLRRGE